MNLATSPKNLPGGGPRTADIFQHLMEIFLHNRPQNHEARNSAPSSQLSGVGGNFRQIGRNVAESRPCDAQPAGRRIRERPSFSGVPEDISTQPTQA